jgi:hypothetical protein
MLRHHATTIITLLPPSNQPLNLKRLTGSPVGRFVLGGEGNVGAGRSGDDLRGEPH